MSKVYFITRQKEFAEDVDTAFAFSSITRYDLSCIYGDIIDYEAANIIAAKPDLILITADVLQEIKKKRYKFESPVKVAVRDKSEENLVARNGETSAGLISNTDDVLRLIADLIDNPSSQSDGNGIKAADRGNNEKTPLSDAERVKKEEKYDYDVEENKSPVIENNMSKKETPKEKNPAIRENVTRTLSSAGSIQQTRPEYVNDSQQAREEEPDREDLQEYDSDDSEDLFDMMIDDVQEPTPKAESAKRTEDTHAKEEATAPKKKTEDYISQELKKDLMGEHGKTKVVTVYSAKGGVGKTKISTEIAECLSLIEAGNRRYRVCIVDCNIDFGDVRSTLSMDAKGPNMAFWADEIKELIEKEGKKPGDIQYGKDEIEKWLRRDKASGMYVLAAPLTNEDSFIVDETVMRVIFRNLINYGDFDFIVCDTGNNTRDSTLVALEMADEILLLMTQDVNTANCNKSFLKMMDDAEYDLSKVRLVVNKIKPQKITKISVEDIEDFFSGYQCIGRIRYSSDVEVSTNEGKPLAFNPDNDFTKQIRNIVRYLTGDIVEDETPQQKSGSGKGFGFLFRKKKKDKKQ